MSLEVGSIVRHERVDVDTIYIVKRIFRDPYGRYGTQLEYLKGPEPEILICNDDTNHAWLYALVEVELSPLEKLALVAEQSAA